MKLGYSKEFDGLRGIAILLVVMSHAKIPTLAGGFIGVDVFFVLSGFLITALLVQEFDRNESRINFRNFYMRRALRLGPALLLFLILYLTLAILFGKDWTVHAYRALFSLFYITNWVNAFQLFNMHVLSHTWSLSIEEQFYILWPLPLYLLLKHVSSRGRIVVIIGILIILEYAFRLYMTGAIEVSWVRVHMGLDTRTDPLLVGCLLGVALLSPRIRSSLELRTRMFGYLGIAGFVFIIVWMVAFGIIPIDTVEQRLRQYHYWGLALTEVSVALIILHVFLSKKSLLKSLLGWHPLVWIGKISYGLYIWHFPIFHATFKVFNSKLDLTKQENVVLVAILAFAVSLVITAASYQFVEAPALKLKRLFPAGSRKLKINR